MHIALVLRGYWDKRAPFRRRQPNECASEASAAELFQTPHDPVQLARQLRLLIDDEFRMTDNLDEKENSTSFTALSV